jgi:hypothetical protein
MMIDSIFLFFINGLQVRGIMRRPTMTVASHTPIITSDSAVPYLFRLAVTPKPVTHLINSRPTGNFFRNIPTIDFDDLIKTPPFSINLHSQSFLLCCCRHFHNILLSWIHCEAKKRTDFQNYHLK